MQDTGVTIHEGALYLKVPVGTLRRWYREGRLRKVAGRFPLSELLRLKRELEIRKRGFSTRELSLRLGIPERTLRRRYGRLLRNKSPWIQRTYGGYRVLPEHVDKFVKELMKEI